MKHPLESLITAAGILLLAMLSGLLLPVPRLGPTLTAQITEILNISLSALYTTLLCLWFLMLGTIEYFVLRYAWRRWFAV